MRRPMRKLCSLNIRHYAEHLTELNKHLWFFLGSDNYNNMGEAEINKIIIYSMPNIWIKQDYLQGFEFSPPFKNTVNMFKWMEIDELIYIEVVIPSKNTTE